MTGRLRNLRPFWSQLGRALAGPVSYNGRVAVEAIGPVEWSSAVERELAKLDLSYEELADMAQRGEFSSLEARKLWVSIGGRREYAIEDRDKAQRQAAALAVEVEQYRTRLAEVEEQRDAMARDLIVLAHRRNDLRRMLAASPEQAYGNCLEMSDRNAELRRNVGDLERQVAEFEGRAAKPSVIEGGRLP